MKYTHLLPFMEEEELKKVAFEIINGELKGVRLERLFPFLGTGTFNELVDLFIEKKEISYLKHAIPFMSREKVQAIYKAAENGEIPGFDASVCIPFLSAEKIKEIFRELIQKASNEPSEDDEDDENDESED